MESTNDLDAGRSSGRDDRLTNEQTYDSALTTMIVKLERYVIPLVNEVFGTDYGSNTKVIFRNQKHIVPEADGSLKRRETDAYVELSETVTASGESNASARDDPIDPACSEIVNKTSKTGVLPRVRCYHFECETWYDQSIVLRIAEYASAVAAENAERTTDGVILKYPDSAVIFLRPGRKIPDSMRITHRAPDGSEMSYKVPALRITDYDVDAIFEKKLLILLPFYLFRYVKEFSRIESDTERQKELKDVLADISLRLEKLTRAGEITVYQQRTILKLLLRISEKLTIKYKTIRKGVDDTMRGYILRTEDDDIWDSGVATGLARGRQEMTGLMNFLLTHNRNDDAIRATTDKNFLEELLSQFRSGTLTPEKP